MSDSIQPQGHHHVDSIQLRLIAEAASGLRGAPVHFVAMEDGSIREVYHGPAEAGGGTPDDVLAAAPEQQMPVVVPAYTTNIFPDRPPLDLAQIQAEGVERPIDLLHLPGGLGEADAVFWSESAVEKFLIPYYASVYGNQATRAVGDILEAFHGDRGDGSASFATDPNALTYAMAHLPKSEYVMLSDVNDMGMSLAVIYKDPDDPGEVRALRLPDFLRWKRERQGRDGQGQEG